VTAWPDVGNAPSERAHDYRATSSQLTDELEAAYRPTREKAIEAIVRWLA